MNTRDLQVDDGGGEFRGPAFSHVEILYAKAFKSKLSGNEVYFTAFPLLAISRKSFSELHRQQSKSLSSHFFQVDDGGGEFRSAAGGLGLLAR